jgi:hypothetical protein
MLPDRPLWRAFTRRTAWPIVQVAAAVIVATALALAGSRTAVAGDHHANGASVEPDTEHLFGFTEGSDIGQAGETELETDSIGRFGKREGSYNAAATSFEAKFTLSDSVMIAPSATVAYYDIAGVPELDNRRQGRLQDLSLELRYRLLNRERAPFGLTFLIDPGLGFTDEVSGARARQYGAEFKMLVDRELVRDRLYAALNLVYIPEVAHVFGTNSTERDSTLGGYLAITGQIGPSLFLGAEARYLEHYEGAALNHFAGRAVYLGPTLYTGLGGRWWLSAAWNFQVSGRAADVPGALDLNNFERYQAKLRIGVSF